MNSMDAPTEHYPCLHLDQKPAEKLDKDIAGATEFMALVKVKVAKRTEVTSNKNEEADWDFERGPIRLELEIRDMTVVPQTRKGMPKMMEQMNQNFKRNTSDRMEDKAAVDAGLDKVMEGIMEMK